MYNIKKLIKKYNDILTLHYKKYGIDYVDLLENSFKETIEELETLQCDCISDSETQYKECEYLKKYFYFKYIEENIEDFKKVVL